MQRLRNAQTVKKQNVILDDAIKNLSGYETFSQEYKNLIKNVILDELQIDRVLDKKTKYSDQYIIESANAINDAQYGGKWYGKKNPVSVLVTSDDKVIVTKNNGVISPKSRDKARDIFGENVVIPAGQNKNFDNNSHGIQTIETKHAEARAIQELLTGNYNKENVRIATTLKSCNDCRNLIRDFNKLNSKNINNLTG